MGKIKLSPKFRDYVKHIDFNMEFSESCTHTGKSTVGIVKFMFMVAMSPKKFHVIAALDLGVAERNLINKDCGLLDVFAGCAEYYPRGKDKISMPHIVYDTPNGQKIIYVLGYADRVRWVKVLGSQFGIVFVDEANKADIAFIQEITMRCDKAMFTQNPDDPNLDWYAQYVNHSRPLTQYVNDYPPQLLEMLDKPVKNKWVHWYFTFDDNAALSHEKRQKIIEAVPKGTKQYLTKILGLRGRSTGLVFSNFDRARHVIKRADLIDEQGRHKKKFVMYTAGLDTAYSSKSADTIAMVFQGITADRELIVLDERIYNNKDLETPIAPSDTARNFVDFLNRNQKEWGLAQHVYIDSADAATISELGKYKRLKGCIYVFNAAYKKMKVIDRIILQLGWLHTGHYKVLEHCKEHIREMEAYSWLDDKDNTPEDFNDHTINASQYGFLPYVSMIGTKDN